MMAKHVVRFSKGRDGAPIARLGGRVALLARGSRVQPQPGELWVVELAGENPRGTVYFVRPLEPMSGFEAALRHASSVEACCGRVRVEIGGQVFTFGPQDHPLAAAMLREAEQRAEEELRQIAAAVPGPSPERLARAQAIRAMITGARRVEAELPATSYQVELLVDTDRGRHEADSGYWVRVLPLLDGTVADPFAKELALLGAELPEAAVEPHDLLSAAEDGDPVALAVSDLVWDRVRAKYARVTVRLTPGQIEEIDARYATRDGRHEFATEALVWLPKELLPGA